MNRKALVVIDIQNDITKHYKDIIDGINSAIDWAVELGMTVIYIKHNNLSPGTAPTEAKRRHRRAAQRKTHFVRCAARARSKIAIYYDKGGIYGACHLRLRDELRPEEDAGNAFLLRR